MRTTVWANKTDQLHLGRHSSQGYLRLVKIVSEETSSKLVCCHSIQTLTIKELAMQCGMDTPRLDWDNSDSPKHEDEAIIRELVRQL